MRKHMFLLTWRREGRQLVREFDTYVACDWPLHESANGVGDAQALLAMIDGYENLPQDVREFCSVHNGMLLRARYAGTDTTGPYIINDVDNAYDRDTLEKYLDTLSDEEVGKYHYRHNTQFTNRRR